jgi:regulator of replication initiation timing
MPRIEAIHAGTTRNYTRYPAEKLRGDESLKSGVYSWMHPFAKPVIYNHDVNTEASGRIQAAAFAEFTAAGRPGIIVVPKITQESAIDDILGGRLLTVSIGATTDAAYCSICGTDIINEGFCGHMKGESYDGVTAEWIVGNVYFDELSWVNVPADSNAMIIGGTDVVHQAESFAFNGKETINLGKKTTEWLVDPKSILAEGVEEPRRGESTLTEEQVKALQEELEALKTQNATLVSEKEALTTEVEQLKTDVEEATTAKTTAETTLSEKEAELATAQESLTAKEAEVTELTSTKESLEAEKAALETSLEEEKTARTQVVEENANLSTEMHKMVAERVVDLRVSLGKESNREEAIASFVGRTTESLNDTLADLLKEAATAPKVAPVRQVTPVENPAANINSTNITESTNAPSVEEVLASLFRGPGARK